MPGGIRRLWEDINQVYDLPLTPGLIDPHKLAPFLGAVLVHMPEDIPRELVGRMHELYDDYRDGNIGPGWQNEVYTDVLTIQNYMAFNPDKDMGFDLNYDTVMSAQRNLPRPENVRIGVTRGISKTIREETMNAHTWEEIDAVMGGLIQAAEDSPNAALAMGPTLPMLRSWKARLEQFALGSSEIRVFGEDNPTRAHVLPEDMLQHSKKLIEFECNSLEMTGMYNRGFDAIYRNAKTEYMLSDHVVEQRGRAKEAEVSRFNSYMDRMDQKIDEIRDVYAKMQAEEKSRWHTDSPEYTAMKETVKKVCELADKGYDRSDFNSLSMMMDAMNNVFTASSRYADKEAFKNKHTTRGIERKNSALVLADITKSANLEIDESRLKDSRMNKHEDRQKRSLSDLINEEKTNNRMNRQLAQPHVRTHNVPSRSGPDAGMGPRK